MKTIFAGLIVALVAGNIQAQKPPIRFGDIPMEDLTMVIYDKDTSASALVLADYGESSISFNQTTGFSLNFERITRIKILSKDGLDWATFSIPLYHKGGENEKMSGLKAVTYNLENKKVVSTKIKSDAVFKEKVDDNWDLMKITLPNVTVGSIVEITYNVNSDFLFQFQDWEFQYTIPVRWSEYRANIPEFYGYDKYMQGYVVLTVSETKDVPSFLTLTSKYRSGGAGWTTSQTEFSHDKVDYMESRSRWVAQDVPAFKPEPFITTPKDYVSKLNFEIAYEKFPRQPIKSFLSTWDEVNTLFSKSDHFGEEVSGNNFLKKTVEELTAGLTTSEQKISAINNYVKSNVEWDGSSHMFASATFRKILEEKKGSSAEINLLLASMLDKADIPAYPVLISTRDHGFVRESSPIASQFNYVICMAKIGDNHVLLDATDKFLPTGVIPERCLNGRGLVINKEGKHSWVNLESPVKSRALYNTDFALNSDGQLVGTVLADRSGYYARQKRKNFFSKSEDEYVKEFVDGKSWVIEKSEFTNANEISEPFKEHHEVVIEDQVISAGDVMYVNPLVVLSKEENPFKLEKREYPVDFGSPLEELLICKITIPDGYSVDELPKSQLLKLPDNSAKYIYSLTQVGNVLTLTSDLQINRSLFSQDDYPYLREFYNMVVSKQAEQIVLKKNN